MTKMSKVDATVMLYHESRAFKWMHVKRHRLKNWSAVGLMILKCEQRNEDNCLHRNCL